MANTLADRLNVQLQDANAKITALAAELVAVTANRDSLAAALSFISNTKDAQGIAALDVIGQVTK